MSQIDDLLDQWEEARERGQSLSAEELCRHHPELLQELNAQIRALEAVSLQFGSRDNEGQISSSEMNWSPASHFELLNRFEIVKLHASGGLGHVYLAHDKVLDRPVAIKFLRRAELTQEQLERFEWEARITGRLEHPGIVPIHSMQQSENSMPCYVMRFVDGKTLHKAVHEFHMLTSKYSWAQFFSGEALRRMLQNLVAVCNIVSYAHSRGVIHRDIKPSNIMLGPFGEILLLDWGIAKPFKDRNNDPRMPVTLRSEVTAQSDLRNVNSIESPAYTSTGQAIGTPAFASPEQLQGSEQATSPSSDVFSLGASLFFILTGKSPLEIVGWTGYLEQFQQLDSRLSSHLPAEVPRKLKAICAKALHVNPQKRYQTAGELAKDIEHYLDREPISVSADSWSDTISRSARKHPRWVTGVVVASIALLLSAFATSLIVGSKNRLLQASEQSLSRSLSETQRANDHAMTALRSLFDGLVLTHFSSKTVLNREDREFLQRSVDQYLAFAKLAGDDQRSTLIKAEAYFQIALMLYWLSQEKDAVPNARQSVALYAQCRHRDVPKETEIKYFEAVRLLSEMLSREDNSMDEGIRLAKNGIQEIDQQLEKTSESEQSEYLKVRCSLKSNVSAGFIQKRDWKNAYSACISAIQDAELVYGRQPTNLASMHALASRLSRAVELSVHAELEVQAEERRRIANRAIELRKQLLDAEPHVPMSQGNWARAHYARALCRAEDAEFANALDDVRVALEYTEPLRSRYPVADVWRAHVVEYRTLAAKLHRSLAEWPEVINQIELARDLQLSVVAMTSFIDLLNEYRTLFPDHEVATDWIAELHFRRANLLGDRDRDLVKQDLLKAVQLYRELVAQDDGKSTYRKLLVQSLIALASCELLQALDVGDSSLQARKTVVEARAQWEVAKDKDNLADDTLESSIRELEAKLR